MTGSDEVVIREASKEDASLWCHLRLGLWSGDGRDAHGEAIARMLADREKGAGRTAFLAFVEGAACAFIELSLRQDYVNGCDTSPVAFIEGISVAEDFRRRGLAKALIEAACDWARSRGCTEIASDAALSNHTSHRMHLASGFEETERVVYFRRWV
ncbi:hypothetical protein BJF92_06895 [Rhizobium rhizosphaerae]|uniref:Aminoglycoside N(6')-acetyltransferase type 1 n=1 Tax=Xaviernesmea rhizosphaerae TaxID=1672749 RepID=A0A1Q9APA2_9HYPH|nr:aminoglycoside 6'-N-acetyltransferase [Xaviernesmea rhizosphaerae]OLP57246.1 hypothetical protein BJF92_06895 [Xaviernesmea rhizosphaerae]